ncbi:MAG: methyltransferase domain-containing protein [Ktedonobacterales bacterium]
MDPQAPQSDEPVMPLAPPDLQDTSDIPDGVPNRNTDNPSPAEWRERLTEQLRRQGALRNLAVERAILTVPRHLFLPNHPLAEAYADIAIATHWEDGVPVSSASQPAIVAVMLAQLQIIPGMRVLEIGAGTGYNAALLAEIVGPTGSVTTVDIDPQITAEASAHLAAAGYPRVRVMTGDGALGWPSGAPYDRIELTVGATDIVPTWFAQLAAGGVLTLPLSLGMTDVSVALRKQGNALISESCEMCGFMRLRGQEADDNKVIAIPRYGLLRGEHAEEIAGPIARLLTTRPRRHFTTPPDSPFLAYLAMRSSGFFSLWRDLPERPDNPAHNRRRPRGRYGVYLEGPDGPSLAIYALRFPMLLAYGAADAEHFLATETVRWREHRVLPIEQWRIIAHPRPYDAPSPADATRLIRRHTVFDVQAGAEIA